MKPDLIEAARNLLSACYSDAQPIAKEIDDVCEAAKKLPPDAAVCSAALLREAADQFEESVTELLVAARAQGDYLFQKHGYMEWTQVYRETVAKLRAIAANAGGEQTKEPT